MEPGASPTRQDARVEAGATARAPALELRGISKSWARLRVLDEVELTLAPGECIWVGGRNGAGKTTLLRIAAGLILPDSGQVSLHGLDPRRDRREFQTRLGFLPAGNTGLYARLSARSNLEFWAGIAFVPRRRRAATIATALARFGLGELGDHRVDRLSMGQRQRVRLAAAFLHQPAVVLLDEPETSLDDEGLATVRTALADHAEAGGAAIVCSPSFAKVELDFDVAYVLEQGRLVSA